MHTNTLGVGLGYMKDLKQMQREGREGLKKFEQHESDGYTVDGQTEMHDLYKASDQHTANVWKAALNSILESGLLEERKKYPPDAFLEHRNEFNSGHNTLARAVKAHLDELINPTK